jgi:hypothetical protein
MASTPRPSSLPPELAHCAATRARDQHRGVALQELDARLTRPLRHAGADYHPVRTPELIVAAGPHERVVRERRGMQHVLRRRYGSLRLRINERNFVRHPGEHERIGSGAADDSCSDDTDLHLPSPIRLGLT